VGVSCLSRLILITAGAIFNTAAWWASELACFLILHGLTLEGQDLIQQQPTPQNQTIYYQ